MPVRSRPPLSPPRPQCAPRRLSRVLVALVALVALAPPAAAASGHSASDRTAVGATVAWPARTAPILRPGRAAATAERTPPTVWWRRPSAGSRVSGILGPTACEAGAGDDVGVARVEFFVDSLRVDVQSTAPYHCRVDTRTLTEGRHVLRAVARDAAGNRAVARRPILVDNVADAPAAGAVGTVLWSDEFNAAAGTSPDESNWGFENGCQFGHGTELQCYTDRPANASHDGQGNLRIVARRETYTGHDGTRHYTSARLTSQSKRAFGPQTRLEARIRIPTTSGLLPAFWTVGANADAVGWPAAGEIDVVEVPGFHAQDVQYHLHGPAAGAPDTDTPLGAAYRHAEDVENQFHVFGVDRYAERIVFFFDGQVKASFTRAQYQAAGGDWSAFQRDHFLLLNIAVGNGWTGPPDASAVWPATMLVDWVRVSALSP